MATAVTVANSSAPRVFRPAMLVMSGRTLAFAATFFIPVILARIFDAAQFGTYKQLFLVWSTVFYIAQAGMSQSLYYFLPRTPEHSGRYAANSFWFLGLAGLVCLAGLTMGASRIAQWLSNPQLAEYLPWIGLYLFFMMLASALEIVMIARNRYGLASVTYATSDLVRAAAFILPVLWFGSLRALMIGAVLSAAVRTVAAAVWLRREFGAVFTPDMSLLKPQLGYALPFGLAVLVEILQASLPQYVVSHLFDPATFAIFAVGCLQIPLVDFAASPTSDVMMVRMQESLAAGNRPALLEIWHDTTAKLLLLFLPLATVAMVNSREIIVLLFTDRYLASAPIFLVWSSMILLTVLQVDGVLRVFAQTRFLLALNLMRLAILAALLYGSLRTFHLLGAAMVCVVATAAFKLVALGRMRRLLEVPTSRLLPWGRLAVQVSAAAAGVVAAVAVKQLVHAPPLGVLIASSATLLVTYAGLLWRFDVLGRELCAE